jgi:hypothetical protein
VAKSKSNQKFISCSVRQLPEDDLHAAAQFACSINPVNGPASGIMAKLGMEPDKMAIAVMTQKYFGQGGVNLSVGFLEQTTAALADKILSHMNAWGAFCNAKFTIFSGSSLRAQVRISRGGGGYWSFLGTDVLRQTQGPTMNLQGFSLQTPESEYRRVIRHETGHTLGCPHEHMRQAIVARLDPQKTIAYFSANQGWSAQEVQQQVLTPISEASIMGTPTAEEDSIMCYQLPGQITIDGKPVVGGVDITKDDGDFMGKIYPSSVLPPPPPPPPDGERVITIGVTGNKARIIAVSQ